MRPGARSTRTRSATGAAARAGGAAGGAAAALAAALLAACNGGAPARADQPPAPQGWKVERRSENQRAIYAAPELEAAAAKLIDQLVQATPGRAPKVAFYYLTYEGERHYLGEWLAEGLATAMVQRAGGRVELYTRRRLLQVIEREIQVQGGADLDRKSLVDAAQRAQVDGIVTGDISPTDRRSLLVNLQVIGVPAADTLAAHLIDLPLSAVVTREPIRRETEVFPDLADAIGRQLAVNGREPPDEGGGRGWRLAMWTLARIDEDTPRGDTYAVTLHTLLGERVDVPRPDLEVMPRKKSTIDQVKTELRAEQDKSRFADTGPNRSGQLMGGNVVATGVYESFTDFYMLDVKVVDVATSRIWAGAIGLVSRLTGGS